MKRHLASCLSIFLVTLLALTGCGPNEQPPASPTIPAQPAEPNKVAAGTAFTAVAHLTGSVETPVVTETGGYLLSQDYKDGAMVKRGDLLFELDPRPFQQALHHAEAQLADRRARLVPADIIKEGVAAVNKAKSDLAAMKIMAPADGIAGAPKHGLGDMIPAGGTLSIISQADPITAVFALPKTYSDDDIKKIRDTIALPVESRPDEVVLVLADGTTYPAKGKWNSVDEPARGAASGTPSVSVLFPNKNGALHPGDDVKVNVEHP
jgi:multidrug efflux pump subunit AcrA (membrane-fusion protein)